ncbi:MAG: Na-translocating system protein MpsC family protein, partial [Solirubrobacteraceae bacterium]
SSQHRRRPPSIRSTSEYRTTRSIPRQDVSVGGTDEHGPQPLVGGRLLAEITNRIVALMREHYGRGPIKAKTYVLDNLIVCVLSDGFTAIERTMMEGGEANRVLEMRRDFQRVMEQRYTEMIEQLTARKVLAFLSQAHIEPDLTIEMFLMDGPVPGFGALELVDPPAPGHSGQGP